MSSTTSSKAPTRSTYVLLPSQSYERVRALFEEDEFRPEKLAQAMNLSRGDVVLLDFPFSGGGSTLLAKVDACLKSALELP